MPCAWQYLLVAALCLAAPVHAWCEPTGADRVKTVTLDARSGNVKATETFPTNTRVTIRLVNKNPFLYRYRVTVNATTVEEPAIAAFLAQLSPVFAAAQKAETAAPGRFPEGQKAIAECSAAPDLLARIGKAVEQVDDDIAFVEGVLQDHKAVQRGYLKDRGTLTNPWAETTALKNTALALKIALDGYLNTRNGAALVEDAMNRLAPATAAATALATAIDDVRSKYKDCSDIAARADWLVRTGARMLDVSTRVVPEMKAQLESTRNDLPTFETARRETSRVLADHNAFEQEYMLPEYQHPTNLAITVDRWPLDDKDEKAKETVIQTTLLLGGGPRFVLSGGIAYVHGVATYEYQPVRGYARDKSGSILDSTTMTSIVGFQQDSVQTVTPMLLLNARLWQEVFASLGTTARKDSDGVHLDYFMGGSFAVLDRKVFLTLGCYRGRELTPGGDLYVGAKIPDDMTSVPTKTTYQNGLAALVTFKIK